MSNLRERKPRLPPRWFVRLAWYAHRGLYRVTRGHVGLWRPKGDRWGTLRLTTTGRRTGQARSVILGYIEDGPNLVTLAMNGWADGASHRGGSTCRSTPPHESSVPTGRMRGDRTRRRRGRNGRACGPGGERSSTKLDAFAALRSSETAVSPSLERRAGVLVR